MENKEDKQETNWWEFYSVMQQIINDKLDNTIFQIVS